MGGHGKGDPRKVVMAAMIGNAGIAIAKFVAAGLSGSLAMLAEAVHSVADTANQGLLLLGFSLSKKADPERNPLGRAAESYFWAFIVALLLFFVGGVFALYEGTEKLIHALTATHPEAHGPVAAWRQWVPVGVLVVSIFLEGGSFLVALREFLKEKGDRPLMEAIFSSKDPTIPIVLLEDSGAMAGLVIALVAIVVSTSTGSHIPDAVGSMLIGLLLCVIGIALASYTRNLLIGEAASPEVRRRARQLVEATEGVDAVTQLLSVHLGPEDILLALKVRFSPGTPVERVEAIIDEAERRVRDELPEMKKIFVEPDSDYDTLLDPVSPEVP